MPLVCFTSPKGGVGKTALSANVAVELARLGAPVVALDLDPQSALGLHFGMDLYDTAGLVMSLRPDSPPDIWRSCLRDTAYGLSVLPHGRASMDAVLAQAAYIGAYPHMLAGPVRDMLSQGIVVVADTPPGPSAQLGAVMPLADMIVTVLHVDATSLSQVPLIEAGISYGQGTEAAAAEGRMAYVLNQYDPRTRLGRASLAAAQRHFGDRLLGVIYRDENVPEAAAAQRPIAEYAPNCKACADIGALAVTIAHRLAEAAQAQAQAAQFAMHDAMRATMGGLA